MAALTGHDKSILDALFDPESSSSKHVRVDGALPSLPQYSASQFAAIRAEEITIMRPLGQESAGVDTATDVICALSRLIERYPEFPSAYINRAQAARLPLSVNDMFTREHSDTSSQVIQDLTHGIDTASPTSPHQPVSDHQAGVLAAGHTHRGFLLLKVAEMTRKGDILHGAGRRLQNATAVQIEELASVDFAAGGRYGNKLAQEMSVRTNPYAKMCGAIVKEAMQMDMREAGVYRPNHTT